MGRSLCSATKCCVCDFFANGDIHRSLGQRPRTLVSFRCLLANGHSQASSVPGVLFIEFDAITVQKVARLFLESSRHMAPEFLAPEFHALISPSPSQGMGAAGCAARGLAADGSHFAESQAFFKGPLAFLSSNLDGLILADSNSDDVGDQFRWWRCADQPAIFCHP